MLSIIPYRNHDDNKSSRSAERLTHEPFGDQCVEVRSRLKSTGFFLFHRRRTDGACRCTEGWFLSLAAAKSAIPEFAKAMGLTLLVLAPMLEGGLF